MQLLIVLAVVVLVAAILAARVRARRAHDGVDSFRRQIDALSPEARRPVIDQVQNAAGRIEPQPDAADSDTTGLGTTGPDTTDGDAFDTGDGTGTDAAGSSEDDDRGT